MKFDSIQAKGRTPWGFTLTELLVVISIIAVLAGLVLKTGGGTLVLSKQRKALGQIKTIENGLEAYRLENGAYPRPIGGTSDPIIQAKMLYQALTGDGTNFIDGVEPVASDGNPGTDGLLILEAAFAGGKKSGFVHEDYYLLDSWHRPYHYMRGDENSETFNKSKFDLWSEGSADSEENEDRWITNW